MKFASFEVVITDDPMAVDLCSRYPYVPGMVAVIVVGEYSRWAELDKSPHIQKLPGNCRLHVAAANNRKGLNRAQEVVDMMMTSTDSGYRPGHRKFIIYALPDSMCIDEDARPRLTPYI